MLWAFMHMVAPFLSIPAAGNWRDTLLERMGRKYHAFR